MKHYESAAQPAAASLSRHRWSSTGAVLLPVVTTGLLAGQGLRSAAATVPPGPIEPAEQGAVGWAAQCAERRETQSLCLQPNVNAAGSARAPMAGAARPRSRLRLLDRSRHDPAEHPRAGGISVTVTGTEPQSHDYELRTDWAAVLQGPPAVSRANNAAATAGMEAAAIRRRAACCSPTRCSQTGRPRRLATALSSTMVRLLHRRESQKFDSCNGLLHAKYEWIMHQAVSAELCLLI
jgi:hypothetical protein